MSNDSFKVLKTEYKGCKQCSNLRLVTFGNTIIEGCACGMPNPRSKEKLEVSTAMGIYRDNVAGAIGIFYHPNDRVQLSIGAAYGGEESWAGNVGVTFSIGGKRKK